MGEIGGAEEEEACRAFSSQTARAAGSIGHVDGGRSSETLAILSFREYSLCQSDKVYK